MLEQFGHQIFFRGQGDQAVPEITRWWKPTGPAQSSGAAAVVRHGDDGEHIVHLPSVQHQAESA